ncbi:MAG: NAD(P)-dependent alcohol dehydrogenase [Tepidisphaeraceae bacterium]
MTSPITALAAKSAKGKLVAFSYDPGPLGERQVEIAVESCGICHSDLSMLDNDWGMTAYPFVPGHEIVGKVVAVGGHVTTRKVGERVGLGWYSGSCMHCGQCMSGDHNLCLTAEATIIGRPGGFATRVRGNEEWVTPLPETLDAASAGPLFCGGITVFNPIVQFGVRPTDHVGVIGIGGLGHLAIKFLRAWGCDVTAFSTSDSKKAEALAMGAHRVVNTRDAAQLKAIAGTFDFILSTINADADWNAYVAALAPRGRLHTVGAVANPMAITAFPMIVGQKSVGGSPLGSPATIGKMIDFCARHKIAPTVEYFPMSRANEALDHLRAGKARYRIVLTNDLQ